MIKPSNTIAEEHAKHLHNQLDDHDSNLEELHRLTQEREQRLVAEEKERQDAASEAAKLVAKQMWMEARIEWNKEVIHPPSLLMDTYTSSLDIFSTNAVNMSSYLYLTISSLLMLTFF